MRFRQKKKSQKNSQKNFYKKFSSKMFSPRVTKKDLLRTNPEPDPNPWLIPNPKNLRDPSNLSAIVSRNVFCGAKSPFLISLPKQPY